MLNVLNYSKNLKKSIDEKNDDDEI
jgi:hypothetical protein